PTNANVIVVKFKALANISLDGHEGRHMMLHSLGRASCSLERVLGEGHVCVSCARQLADIKLLDKCDPAQAQGDDDGDHSLSALRGGRQVMSMIESEGGR